MLIEYNYFINFVLRYIMYIVYLSIALLIVIMLLFNNYNKKINNIFIKVITLTYVIVTFLTIFLPDGFIKSVDDPIELQGLNKWHGILRILLWSNPVIVTIAVFFNNKTFKKL